MKQSIIFVLFLLLSTNILSAADAVAGKNKSIVCGACHGPDGNSFNPVWPSLAGQNATYLAKQLTDFRDGKRTDVQMAPMAAALTDADIADIAAYFSSMELKSGSTDEKYVALGSQIYTGGLEGVMACTGCHGPDGAGLEAAGFPQVSSQQTQYVINQLNNFKNGIRANDASTMMSSIAANMSEEQITAVANYLSGLH
ncbi:MAG: cytochrome c4 [Gammaproteobacteria bacterium]|nr:MAG: cytochrome c4 [Gammaproteobacteria bacterium]